jgi:Domain of unknown function (DUF4833)
MHTLVLPRRALLGLLPLLLAERAFGAEPSRTLFFISKSTNANVVHYDVRMKGDGLDPRRPVVAYWVMRAEDGHREPLSWLEQQAYGFELVRHDARSADLRLTAFPERLVAVRRAGGRHYALTRIANRAAWLESVYVKVSESLIPGVDYVDVFGRAAKSGQLVRERLRK